MTVRLPAAVPRRAFTLMDMVWLMGILGMVMLLGMVTLLGAFRTERAAAAAQTRFLLRSALADRFRADVSQAVALPDAHDNDKAGPTCLILRRPDGRHVVYRWDKGELDRSEQTAKEPARQHLPTGPECLAAEFLRPEGQRRTVTLRLRERPGVGSAERFWTVAAALGGDVR
jgi:hypothetical protein